MASISSKMPFNSVESIPDRRDLLGGQEVLVHEIDRRLLFMWRADSRLNEINIPHGRLEPQLICNLKQLRHFVSGSLSKLPYPSKRFCRSAFMLAFFASSSLGRGEPGSSGLIGREFLPDL